jgi:predicted dehydrogenase
MIKVGICGIGFMGWIHWLAYQRVPGVRVSAICSASPQKRAGDWRGIQGNFGPPGEQVDLTGVTSFATLEEMAANADVDVIDICLPPDQHVSAGEIAFGANKHVFCEKPLALDVTGCQRLVDAAARAQRRLFVGHVLPYFPEYQWALSKVQSGAWGRLRGGHFKRVISRPTWIPDFFDPQKVGGPLIDLHVHDAHLICWLFGMPQGVFSRAQWEGTTAKYVRSIFDFADQEILVSSDTGVIDTPSRPFTHGFELHLERAVAQFELAVYADQVESLAVKILTEDGQVLRPQELASDPIAGFAGEISEWMAALTADRASPIMDGSTAAQAIRLCAAEAESAHQRRYIALR